jgi:type I restriction enzyme, S subunit
MGLFNRIASNEMTERLDAEFYKPIFIEVEHKLSEGRSSSLGDMLENLQLGYTGPTEKYYDKNGYFYLSSKNVSDGFVNITDATDKVSLEAHRGDLSNTAVFFGDVLITRTGTVGKSGVISEDLGEANTAAHVISLRLKEGYDGFYLSAFLNTSYGMLQSKRHQRGTIIRGLSVFDIPGFLVPDIEQLAQKYIGDKVRLAERLRACAKELEIAACLRFDNDLNWNDQILDVPSYSSIPATEMAGRLDLKFNSPERIAVKRHFANNNIRVSHLSDLVDISAMVGWKGLTTEYYRKDGPWLLRGVEFHNGVIKTEDLVCVDEFKYAEQPQIHLQEYDIAFSKDGTIGKAIVIPKLTNRIAAGSTIARLRVKEGLDLKPHYLEFLIAQPCVQVQIESFATGIAQPHITQEWVAQLEIPRLDCEANIASDWLLHHNYLNNAKYLVESAKMCVEALIDNKLAEQQLNLAQQALDCGDNSQDRDILSRLTTKGFDVDGDPLFPDLDQLYDLLTLSQEIME